MSRVPLTNKRRLIIAFIIFAVVLILLAFKTGYIQVVQSDELTDKAIDQQMKDEIIEAKRGDILDRNNNKLATSTIKYSVWVRPSAFQTSSDDEENEEAISEVVTGLSEILDMDADELREELESDKTLIKVAKYQENETAEKIREWTSEEDISGISITEETKRYYPLDTMAAQVLGNVSDDNNGLAGLEQYYNSYLKGVPGRWIQNKDASGRSLSYGDSTYYEAEDGASLVTTLDIVIQKYAEEVSAKYLKKHKADRVSCIVMETETGEILAMSSLPTYNPNNAREPISEEDQEEYDKLDEDEQMDYLTNMWRNPLVNDTYVPGSTMKLMTTSMALEEDLTTLSESFYDSGSIDVDGTTLKCWSYKEPHGQENLKEAIKNSCNPVFVQLAQRVGIEKFYSYLDLFGVTEQTGIDYPGEAVAQLQDINSAGNVGLSTMGYGQGIAVTPIEQITAINAIANDGKLVKPHLVKEIVSADGDTIEKIEPEVVRKVVSSDTASDIREAMEYVVSAGGAGDAKDADVKIGGKTATSNVEANDNMLICSFVGVAPIDDPEITVLFIVENPEGEQFGSTAAAPGGAEIIEKTLKYMDAQDDE